MKKYYIRPIIKGHRIITPSLLAGSYEDGDNGNGEPPEAKRATFESTSYAKPRSLFDDEPQEKNNFAYGL